MPTDNRPLAIFLMGPTASGKTDLAMALHERLGAELISVDSAMVYRGMDIGTAKPSPEELVRAPHRLIDIRDPAEPYSAAQFRDDARDEMRRISARGNIPLLVGGTMLYYKSLVGGVGSLPEANGEVRAELEAWAGSEGLQALHDELQRVDPESALRIHPNDPQRLMRALEIHRITGRAMSELWREQPRETFPWRTLSIGLAPADRHVLHERIARRFTAMLEAGFIDEVAGLRQRGDLHLGLPSMKSVGYRQVWQHLDGVFDEQDLKFKGIAATRQLAKRQITWLRRWPALHWIDSLGNAPLEEILNLVRHWRS
ncbi:tRNA (adenosine(37)-N6)-dimethylallyltransferase MiaA [Halomonas sp. McH1-25]|uniref:tRNA (adenosine(37)-N6)-dimethylallyltransferase MiaA n=1 Tax=unclassified Halomonas TaxID=2609666 RepID=UPI001EF4D56E|nr:MULTISPECIES: tRNA (adenosine(37)-N6)-dimethylallyltransferase MiaA [unclassified Halomonas]MCG7600336.1 tRNA (adenosine(37)-N6)-dimethylallyltransferase MiaA [Halomonas sp. McH1-25]MCP1342512.1 tRNA (adenosine(37)-N6)-dimethylallyltransferase MiaA [Halomonas sp. FL8]MCP1359551.1 tRNA (adenosine(37)-N6)-dimethylallyltransferase MiaA [Halomonas sp. BBD45]MCP1365241.1 tRNA (adenosine(37)-N6)-dimethylallyltransferase MiaA [Halomonas sp. BBD48]